MSRHYIPAYKMSQAQALQQLTPEQQKEAILKYVPQNEESPRAYMELVKTQVMGVDRQGNQRPFEDFLYFMRVASKTQLDPVSRQLFAIYRWDSRLGREKMTIQTSVDGLRLIAERTGKYAGQDETVYDPKDESTPFPKKASVTVYKLIEGQRVAYTASARWAEFAQLNDKTGEPEFMWKKMPYHMLGKCAEALAYRKAFPQELSGIYSGEEMPTEKIELDTPEKFVKPERIQEPVQEVKPEPVIETPIEKTAESMSEEQIVEVFKPSSLEEDLLKKREALRGAK